MSIHSIHPIELLRIAADREEIDHNFVISTLLKLSHIPNDKTIASVEASEKGKNVKKFNSMDDLYKDLGI